MYPSVFLNAPQSSSSYAFLWSIWPGVMDLYSLKKDAILRIQEFETVACDPIYTIMKICGSRVTRMAPAPHIFCGVMSIRGYFPNLFWFELKHKNSKDT